MSLYKEKARHTQRRTPVKTEHRGGMQGKVEGESTSSGTPRFAGYTGSEEKGMAQIPHCNLQKESTLLTSGF